MAKRIIDLTLTIDPDARHIQFPRKKVMGAPEPPAVFSVVQDIDTTGFLTYGFSMTTQSFTHIDAPCHCVKGAMANHEVPLESMVGEAVVIDMTHKKPNESVTGDDLEHCGVEVRKGDIVIIRTGWTDEAWGTERFWEEMICLDPSACAWLVGKEIRALAQDFMTDEHPLHPPAERAWPSPKRESNHPEFLGRNIILIEWCTNLKAITKERVLLICLPIKLLGTDGAPARVIAIEED